MIPKEVHIWHMNNLHGTSPSKTLHIFNYSCNVKRKIMHTHLRVHITDLVFFLWLSSGLECAPLVKYWTILQLSFLICTNKHTSKHSHNWHKTENCTLIYKTGLKNHYYISNKTNIYNNDRHSFFDIMLKHTKQSATSVQSSYIYCFFIGWPLRLS